MRLSEKTIEINWCAQFVRAVPHPAFWFGLTQKQEARAGFDVCTRIGGRLEIYQFKASNYILKSGARQFRIRHDQLSKLQARVSQHRRSIYYVFPSIGDTGDIVKDQNVLVQSQLMDVADVPSLDVPARKDGQFRKSGLHYVDVVQGWATIHSDAVEVKLSSPISSRRDRPATSSPLFRAFDELWEIRQYLPRASYAVLVRD